MGRYGCRFTSIDVVVLGGVGLEFEQRDQLHRDAAPTSRGRGFVNVTVARGDHCCSKHAGCSLEQSDASRRT